MRNFDEEIKELEKDIKNLEITKEQKRMQLTVVKRKQRETQEAEQASSSIVEDTIRDHYGKPILVGDWVNVTKKGKFNGIEGTVVKFKKWVTFEDTEGIKQFRASHNLIVSDLPASEHVRDLNPRGKPRR